MKNKIRLVIADVDGTLVTKDKILTPRAIASVQRLRDADIAFTITSGRPPVGMKMLIEPLGLTEPIAAFNGGVFVHPDLSVMAQSFLSSISASDPTGIRRRYFRTRPRCTRVRGW
jgi:HAD superfamily hydrolase (TIGR01484 family)